MRKMFIIFIYFLIAPSVVGQNIQLLTPTYNLTLIEGGEKVTYYWIVPTTPFKIKVNGPAELEVIIRIVSHSRENLPSESSFIVTTQAGKSSSYKIRPTKVELNNFFERPDLFPTNPVVLKLKVLPGMHEYTFSAKEENKLGFAIKFLYKPQMITHEPVVKEELQKLVEKEAGIQPTKKKKDNNFLASVNFSTGVNFERYAGRSSPFFKLTGEIEYYFIPLLSLDVSIGGDFYKQNYFTYDENNSLLTVDNYLEKRLLSSLLLSIHSKHAWKKIDLAPKIGFNLDFVFSKSNSFNIGGPSAGLGVEVIFDKHSFLLEGNYTYNFFRKKPENILVSAPEGSINYNGIFLILLTKQIRLKTGYSGESIIFPQVTIVNQGNADKWKRVIRYYHGILIGMEF